MITPDIGERAAGPASDAEIAQQGGFDEETHADEAGVVLSEDGTRTVEVDDCIWDERAEEENDG